MFLAASNVIDFTHVVDATSFLVLEQFLLFFAVESFIGFLLGFVSEPGVDLVVVGVFEGLLDLVFFVELVEFLVLHFDEGLLVFEG